METSMAQMAYEVLGIDPENVMVTHGDTGLTPWLNWHLRVTLNGDGGWRDGEGL